MTKESTLWTQVYRAFDPYLPLSTEQIETLYVERPHPAAAEILTDLQIDPDNSGLFVICGSRGSGKSTELSRLGAALHETHVVARIDLQNALPEPQSATSLVLVVGILALRILEDFGVDKARRDPLRKALQKCVDALAPKNSGANIDVGSLVAGVTSVATVVLPEPAAKVANALIDKAGRSIRLAWSPGAGQSVMQATDQQRDALRLQVNAILDAVREETGKPLILLADGLDKLDNLDQVLRVLDDPQLLLHIAAPLVLTGPINLLHSPAFRAVGQHARTVALYNLVVRTRDGQAGPGIAALRDIAFRRLDQHRLPRRLIASEAMQHLAELSGGSVRDFIGLVRGAARESFKADLEAIELDQAEVAVRNLRHEMQLAMDDGKLRELAHVLRTHQMSGNENAQELLFLNYVLCYPNSTLWFMPHSALLEVVEASAQREATASNGDPEERSGE